MKKVSGLITRPLKGKKGKADSGISLPTPDTTPNAFDFVDQTDVAVNTLVESAGVVIGGIDSPAAVSVAGGEYKIDAGGWVTADSTITNGQTVYARRLSSAAYETPVSVTVTIGGVSATFTITTEEEPVVGALTAPTLAWESAEDVNPPLLVIGLPDDTEAGDHIVVEVSDDDGGSWDPYLDVVVDDPDGEEQDETAAALEVGDYVFRARMERGAEVSDWSTEVDVTISGYAFRNWVAQGDSITAWVDGWADQAEAAAVPAITSYDNLAVGGSGLGQPGDAPGTPGSMFGRAAAVDALLVTGGTNILSVFIGANGTDADFMPDLAEYCDDRRAAGWYVILCTLLPNAVINASVPSRTTINTELRLWTTNGVTVPGQHIDAICDFGGDPQMGDDADYADTDYFSDGVHPTDDPGHIIMRKAFQPVLDAARRVDNTAPTITSVDNDSTGEGSPYSLQLTADESCFFSVAGAGYSIFERDTLVQSATTDGTYEGTITATDGSGNSSTQDFTLEIVAAAGATFTITDTPPGQAIGFGSPIVNFNNLDVNNSDASDVILVFVTGAGRRPEGITIDGNAMTRVVESNPGAGGPSIWKYTGGVFTTPDIVVSATFNFNDIILAIGVLTGVNSAETDTAALADGAGGANPQVTSSSLTVAAGYGVFCYQEQHAGPVTVNTGVEDCETSFGFLTLCVGHITATASPSLSGNGFAGNAIAAAAWEP
jgi:hypothetical protein